MKKIIILLFCILSLNSFAEDVEVTLTSPIVTSNELNFDITGDNSINSLGNACNQFIAGYDSCLVSNDIITVVYPLALTTNIQVGFMGTLYVDIEANESQFFDSVRLIENDIEVAGLVQLYENDAKNYKVEIKMRYKGANAFSQPKGAINFILNATAI